MAKAQDSVKLPASGWTFLSNHTHVLICIIRNPSLRVRDLAALVGITDRAVQSIISDLEEGGYVSHERYGRCNRYKVRAALPMRHPIERHCLISSVLAPIVHRASGIARASRGKGISHGERRAST